ncbi:MAG: hypothetical protein ACU0BS_12035 [Hasllibacter sp.]
MATRGALSRTEWIALALTAGWLALCALIVFGLGIEAVDGTVFFTVLMTVFLPVALIWVAAVSARSIRVMREESRRLEAAIEGMRRQAMADARARTRAEAPAVEARIGALTRRAEAAVATFASVRAPDPAPAPAAAPAPAGDQPALALGTGPGGADPVASREDVIRAMNFPDDPSDAEGFSALRRALRDRQVEKLVRAAQDVLTLLAQDGIYMDDIPAEATKPELWRRFADGRRGREVAGLGGVQDRSALALAAGRMRGDTIFRDAAHHFLRQFDLGLARLEPQVSDAEIAALSRTRTAKAFMLLARAAGTFG